MQKWLDWIGRCRFPASLSRTDRQSPRLIITAQLSLSRQTVCGPLSQYSFSLMYSCSCNFNVICGRIQMVGSWMGAARRQWRCQKPWVHNNTPNTTHTIPSSITETQTLSDSISLTEVYFIHAGICCIFHWPCLNIYVKVNLIENKNK